MGKNVIQKEVLIKLFGQSWYEALEEYISSEVFASLASTITGLRNKYTIFPARELLFRAFELTPYDKVKVVLYGTAPYTIEDLNDGLAFSNGMLPYGTETSPILNKLLYEVDCNYPEWINEVNYGRLEKEDLKRWATLLLREHI